MRRRTLRHIVHRWKGSQGRQGGSAQGTIPAITGRPLMQPPSQPQPPQPLTTSVLICPLCGLPVVRDNNARR